MHQQFSTPRTITTKSGDTLPATINQQSDFNMITTAMAVYYKLSGCLGSFDTAITVADAMRDSSAVVVLSVGLDGGQDARVLWPNAIGLTKENKVVCKAYCTMRREMAATRMPHEAQTGVQTPVNVEHSAYHDDQSHREEQS